MYYLIGVTVVLGAYAMVCATQFTSTNRAEKRYAIGMFILTVSFWLGLTVYMFHGKTKDPLTIIRAQEEAYMVGIEDGIEMGQKAGYYDAYFLTQYYLEDILTAEQFAEFKELWSLHFPVDR